MYPELENRKVIIIFSFSQAPIIYHGLYRPDRNEIESIVSAAADNARLTANEKKLLVYYSSCGKGFRPALKEIEKQTGIKSNKVSSIRKSLRRYNMIDYECSQAGHFIFLNWRGIREYASLEKPMKVGGRARNNLRIHDLSFCVGHPQKKQRRIERPLYHSKYCTRASSVMSKAFQDFLSWAGGLTSSEYEFIANALLDATNASFSSKKTI